MNLQKLLETQVELDKKNMKEKSLTLDKKILALQVELGELANEWQKGRTYYKRDCRVCKGFGFIVGEDDSCFYCNGTGYEKQKNPLLEEYVDCLDSILSIGNDTIPETDKVEKFIHPKKMPNILDQFMWTNKKIVDMYEDYRDKKIPSTSYHFTHVFSAIWGLGEMLGFTWDEIEKAYLERKNKL